MILLCFRTSELMRPLFPSVVLQCADCAELVWRSRSAVLSDPSGVVCCIQCGMSRAEQMKIATRRVANCAVDSNVAASVTALGGGALLKPLRIPLRIHKSDGGDHV